MTESGSTITENQNILKRQNDEIVSSEMPNPNKKLKYSHEVFQNVPMYDETESSDKMKNYIFSKCYYSIFDDSCDAYFLEEYYFSVNMLLDLIDVAIKHKRMKILGKLLSKVYEISKNDYENLSTFEKIVKSKFTEAFTVANTDLLKILSQYVPTEFLSETLIDKVQKRQLFTFHLIVDNISMNTKSELESILKDDICINGNVNACKVLLELGLDPNGYHNDVSYLMNSFAKGYIEIVKLLIERGGDINKDPSFKGNALLLAAQNGHIETVKYLLEKGADVTFSDHKGCTPLIKAIYCNSFEIFSLIFEKDKNIHQKSKEGYTPFIHSCVNRNLDIVKALVGAGANVNEIFERGYNCLHYAATNNQSLDILIYLMGEVNNVDEMLNAKNMHGETPLNFITMRNNSSYLSKILKAKPELCKFFNAAQPFNILDNENKDICPICRDEYLKEDQALKLPCNHIFHRDCVLEWLKIDNSCPYCRKEDFKVYL